MFDFTMFNGGIRRGVYATTTETTLQDLKTFQNFLYHPFKNHNKYKKMLPTSNQPAQMYKTAKTNKFDSTNTISIEELKFCPIIVQTGTYTYDAALSIAEYLKPFCDENPHIIRNTQDFLNLLKDKPPLEPDEEYLLYDVESLLTNILIKDTIEYILDQVYNKQKLEPLCSKLIFKRLLVKLTIESTFIFDSKYYKPWADHFR